MTQNIQHRHGRTNPPRVHITYDVHTGNIPDKKELPFVAGVLGNFAGNPEKKLPKIKERKFIEVHTDNFNEVLAGMKPRLTFQVDNKLKNDDSKINVELNFQSIKDFHPENVAKQIPALRKLVEAREKLSSFRDRIYTNDDFKDLIQEIIENTDSLEQLRAETGAGTSEK